jgi:hypothetical protein
VLNKKIYIYISFSKRQQAREVLLQADKLADEYIFLIAASVACFAPFAVE